MLERLARRARPVEEELVVARPDLGVPRHRLAVEAEVVGVRGEERDRDLVGEGAVAREPLVARDALPPVRAGDVGHHPVALRVLRRIVLVEPARLRDPELVALFAAAKKMQERDLRRVRQRGGEVAVARVLVEEERRGARDELELAREVRPLNGGGEAREWLERQQRVHGGVERRVAEEASAREGGEVARVAEDSHARERDIAFAGGPGEEAGEGRLVREASPERGGGAGVARAEERPADVPLVVLRPGETERHRDDERILGESAAVRGLDEGRGPGGVAVEERAGEGVAVAADELSELVEDVVGEEREAGLESPAPARIR